MADVTQAAGTGPAPASTAETYVALDGTLTDNVGGISRQKGTTTGPDGNPIESYQIKSGPLTGAVYVGPQGKQEAVTEGQLAGNLFTSYPASTSGRFSGVAAGQAQRATIQVKDYQDQMTRAFFAERGYTDYNQGAADIAALASTSTAVQTKDGRSLTLTKLDNDKFAVDSVTQNFDEVKKGLSRFKFDLTSTGLPPELEKMLPTIIKDLTPKIDEGIAFVENLFGLKVPSFTVKFTYLPGNHSLARSCAHVQDRPATIIFDLEEKNPTMTTVVHELTHLITPVLCGASGATHDDRYVYLCEGIASWAAEGQYQSKEWTEGNDQTKQFYIHDKRITQLDVEKFPRSDKPNANQITREDYAYLLGQSVWKAIEKEYGQNTVIFLVRAIESLPFLDDHGQWNTNDSTEITRRIEEIMQKATVKNTSQWLTDQKETIYGPFQTVDLIGSVGEALSLKGRYGFGKNIKPLQVYLLVGYQRLPLIAMPSFYMGYSLGLAPLIPWMDWDTNVSFGKLSLEGGIAYAIDKEDIFIATPLLSASLDLLERKDGRAQMAWGVSYYQFFDSPFTGGYPAIYVRVGSEFKYAY